MNLLFFLVVLKKSVVQKRKISNLKLNKDFYLGYSPERINPGDKEHTISKS